MEKGKTQTDHATQPVETNEDVQIENTRNPKRSSLLPTARYILNYISFKFFYMNSCSFLSNSSLHQKRKKSMSHDKTDSISTFEAETEPSTSQPNISR